MRQIPLWRRSVPFGGDPAASPFQISSIPRRGGLEPGDPDLGDPVDFVVAEFSLDFSSIWFLFTAANFADKSFVINTCSSLDGSMWKVYCLTKGDEESVVGFLVAVEVGCSGSAGYIRREREGNGGRYLCPGIGFVSSLFREINTARKGGTGAGTTRRKDTSSICCRCSEKVSRKGAWTGRGVLLYTGRGDRQAAGGAAAVAAGRDREERVAVCTGKGVAVVSGGCGVTFLFFRVLIAESISNRCRKNAGWADSWAPREKRLEATCSSSRQAGRQVDRQ